MELCKCKSGGAQLSLSCQSTHYNAAIHCRLQRPEWLRNGCTGAVQRECSPPELLAAHDTQLQTWYGMTSMLWYDRQTWYGLTGMVVQMQERGGAGGAAPPQNCAHYIMYNFNASCSAGSAPFLVIRRITPLVWVECSFKSLCHRKSIKIVWAQLTLRSNGLLDLHSHFNMNTDQHARTHVKHVTRQYHMPRLH